LTECTGVAGWRTPPEANVANASVISSGVTSFVPRVIEHGTAPPSSFRGLRIPIRRATSATFSGPTSTTSWA
jgi:hypothetical protein